jgi:thiol:disulfide interchange protein
MLAASLFWGMAVLAGDGKFDPTRNAQKDLDDAVAEAARSGRNVLVDVGGEWCIWCKRLDKLFDDNRELKGFRDSNYVTVKVNYSKEQPNTAVLSKFPAIKGYPHLFVLNARGEFLRSQDTGELEEGKGHSPEKVMSFLRQWAPSSAEMKSTTEEKK